MHAWANCIPIVYQDEYLVVVNKPSGILVHRTSISSDEVFLLQILRDQLGQHVYPIHRLDRPTSGLLVFALSSEIASKMSAALREQHWVKKYHAIVRGWMHEKVDLDYPLRKIKEASKQKKGEPQEARSIIKPLHKIELDIPMGDFPSTRYTLVEVQPFTGRYQQIRRHLAHLSHPIIGDTNWGDGRYNRLFRENFDSHRLLLNASYLEFEHPVNQQLLQMSCLFDENWQNLCEKIGLKFDYLARHK